MCSPKRKLADRQVPNRVHLARAQSLPIGRGIRAVEVHGDGSAAPRQAYQGKIGCKRQSSELVFPPTRGMGKYIREHTMHRHLRKALFSAGLSKDCQRTVKGLDLVPVYAA